MSGLFLIKILKKNLVKLVGLWQNTQRLRSEFRERALLPQLLSLVQACSRTSEPIGGTKRLFYGNDNFTQGKFDNHKHSIPKEVQL